MSAVEISAALVKELRGLTGAGMMDCKRTLQETGGDIQAARTLLREKGMARAGKRADRWPLPDSKFQHRGAPGHHEIGEHGEDRARRLMPVRIAANPRRARSSPIASSRW